MSYCERTDIEALFGRKNTAAWADLDGNENTTAIAARITAAIAYADGEIDDTLRHGPYAVPLTGTHTSITDAAARLAGVWLYESRRLDDDDENDSVSRHEKHARDLLKSIMTGQRRLDETEVTTRYPQVVEDA